MLLMCGFVTILAAALPVLDFATNSIARRIESCDPAVCLARFADYPPSKGKLGFPRCLFENPFPANPHFYLKDVDFSCASPWNDSTGTLRAGTLISKRHIIFAKHFPLWKGVRILLHCCHQGGCGSGPAVHLYAKEIQQAMDDLCPGYKLEEFDFSRLIERD